MPGMPALRFTCAEMVVALIPAADAPPPAQQGRRRACYWRTAGLVALMVVVAVAPGLVLTWPAWGTVPVDFGWRAFDAGAWRSADPDTDTVRVARCTYGHRSRVAGPPAMRDLLSRSLWTPSRAR